MKNMTLKWQHSDSVLLLGNVHAWYVAQVDEAGLNAALTTRTTFAHGETIKTPLSADQAMDVRDAFVKGIYGKVFWWIVTKINKVIFKPKV